MARFSDPNYYLLSNYFSDVLSTTPGNNSYIIGPKHTISSTGGLYEVLYEESTDRGFVGHRFKILEIDGNRFKMHYEGLESTFSIATSAIDIGNPMYFRKDSFFHVWLQRPEQDNYYHDYCNQDKIFMFFGRIWPTNEDNVYAIEFQGMKDFAINAIPQNNRTIKMEEFLNVYWDQVNHEMYNMTKTFWSMLDAREIDLKWLGYIAGIYGIEISEELILNELSLREWVDFLPSFLKRVGTYNALYIIWKVFMKNTKNKLNVYERWGEWCSQTDGIKDEFYDHHFLEFYGIQPSGGSGDYYYSQYNPSNYPTHAVVAPSGDCTTYEWDTGFSESYLTFTALNIDDSIEAICPSEIDIDGYNPARTSSQSTEVIYLSGGNYSGDFIHSTGVQMNSSITQPSNIVFWALSNEVNKISDMGGNYLSLSFETSGSDIFFKLIESESLTITSVKSTYSYSFDTPYYLIIERSGSDLIVKVYSEERRRVDGLLETFTLSLSSVDTYTILYALNGRRIVANEWYGKILKLSLDNTYTQVIAASGSSVLTPHYKVQIDLSSESLGNIFDDSTIISEGVVKELIRNFEYTRPVSKYVHYEELIAPLTTINRTGVGTPLYSSNSNGKLITYFTGSQSLSGSDLGGDNTYSYYQRCFSKTWVIEHNLNSPYVLVQPWAFTDIDSQTFELINPENISIIDNNTVELTFVSPVNGVASIAGSGDFGITYIENSYNSSPNSVWTINHNLSTNTPSGSGYTSDVGPVVFHYDTGGNRIVPSDNLISNSNTLQTTWSESVSGNSIIRRSDYIHTQSSSTGKWIVNHNLNSGIIVQCYDYITNKEIIPDEIKILDRNSLEIYWSSGKAGYANIIKIIQNNVIFSPYDCDITGLGICENLGYWKVGTGTSTSWNPYDENDLESPATSGSYKSIEEDSNNFYVNFIVSSDFEDVNITEVGLFNYQDDLVFYSKCDDLFKPKGVKTYFHYRIGKL